MSAINDDVLRDQILDHLACVFAPGELAYISGTTVKVKIIKHHSNGDYEVIFPCGLWADLDHEVILYSGRVLTPVEEP